MTKPQTVDDKKQYLEKHFRHELELLLTATDARGIYKCHNLGMLTAIPRDSASVHFRTLVKFFINKTTNNDVSVGEFGTEKYSSRLAGCRKISDF